MQKSYCIARHYENPVMNRTTQQLDKGGNLRLTRSCKPTFEQFHTSLVVVMLLMDSTIICTTVDG